MPFCKFCKDAGLPAVKYTSHYPKDKPGKDGKVVCPTILNNECRYCHKIGHAKSHCQVLKNKNNKPRFNRRRVSNSISLNKFAGNRENKTRYNKVYKVKNTKSNNKFDVLDEEDIEHTEMPLPQNPKAIKGIWSKKPDFNKASEVAKLAENKQQLKAEAKIEITPPALKRQYTVPIEMVNPIPQYIGAWADAVEDSSDEDSDSEEDEIVLDSYGRPTVDNSAW